MSTEKTICVTMWLKLLLICFFCFNCILSHSFDLSGVVTGNRMAAVPLGRTLGEGEIDVEGLCMEAGMACQNCTHAVTCIPLPVGWLKVPLQQCTDGQTCNAHLRQCSNEAVPECEDVPQKYNHVCEQVGIFPDAYDCRKFHLCSPPEGLPDGKPAEHRTAICPRNYGYDPSSAQCSIKLKNGQCSEKPVPDCAKVGQFGALETSANHYYVCLSRRGMIYPQIFICPHGWYFWGSDCHPDKKPDNSPITKDGTQSKENHDVDNKKLIKTTSKPVYKVDTFFSTEKSTTYPADTFLADKFDLTNYEVIDDAPQIHDDFADSLESNESW